MGAKLKIFCAAKVHCETCRSATIAGLAWRLQLLRHLDPKPEGGGGGGGNWICPEGKPFDGTPPEEKDVPAELIEDPTADNVARLAAAGRAHWERAHGKRSWTAAEFEEWRAGIPSFGCTCPEDADQYIAANPPPIGDDDGMFIWFWRFHDKKNRELKKAIVTLEEARVMYGRPITDNAPPAA